MPSSLQQVIVRLDPEDLALLKSTARAEKLPQTEVLRRSLRAYAENLGVPKAKWHKPKKSASR